MRRKNITTKLPLSPWSTSNISQQIHLHTYAHTLCSSQLGMKDITNQRNFIPSPCPSFLVNFLQWWTHIYMPGDVTATWSRKTTCIFPGYVTFPWKVFMSMSTRNWICFSTGCLTFFKLEFCKAHQGLGHTLCWRSLKSTHKILFAQTINDPTQGKQRLEYSPCSLELEEIRNTHGMTHASSIANAPKPCQNPGLDCLQFMGRAQQEHERALSDSLIFYLQPLYK